MDPCPTFAHARVARGALCHDGKDLTQVFAREGCSVRAAIDGVGVDRNGRDGGARQRQPGGEQSDRMEGVDQGGV